MYEAADIEMIARVPGGMEITLRGDYTAHNIERRERSRIELDWSAVEKIVERLGQELDDRLGKP